jgi:hypothetical protein
MSGQALFRRRLSALILPVAGTEHDGGDPPRFTSGRTVPPRKGPAATSTTRVTRRDRSGLVGTRFPIAKEVLKRLRELLQLRWFEAIQDEIALSIR